VSLAIDPLHPIAHPPGADHRLLARIGAGIALSLALHALLLSIYRQPRPAVTPAPADRLTVRLQPARPAQPEPPVPAAPAEAQPARAAPKPADTVKPAPARRTRPARPVIAVSPETRQSQEDTKDNFKVEPAPATPDNDAAPSTTPAPPAQFDIGAARGMARKLANEPDPAKVGTALERLPPKPLETESRLARGIKAAKRGNCKDGVPGGLLAPLYLMMDKKDSGCKW